MVFSIVFDKRKLAKSNFHGFWSNNERNFSVQSMKSSFLNLYPVLSLKFCLNKIPDEQNGQQYQVFANYLQN